MRYAIWLLMALFVAAPNALARKKYDWHNGRVMTIVQGHVSTRPGPAERGATRMGTEGFLMPEIHESLAIEGQTAIYSVERTVFYKSALRLEEGDPVRYAIDGRAFVLRIGDKQYKFNSFQSSARKKVAP